MEQEICGTSIKKSLADYINSKEHRESICRISSASIKEHHKNYDRYRWIEDMVGKDLRIVFTGLIFIDMLQHYLILVISMVLNIFRLNLKTLQYTSSQCQIILRGQEE